MESPENLKWISIVSLATLFIALFNYGMGLWSRSFWKDWTYGLNVVFLLLDIATLSLSTLFTSGTQHKTMYKFTISFFAVSMIFLFLALWSTLGVPLTFSFF